MDWLLQTVSSTTEALRTQSSAVREWISINHGKSAFILGSTISAIYVAQAALQKKWEIEPYHGNGNAFPSQTPQIRNTQFKTR
jgi:hypothetical protein